jgi:uncharacterized protein YcbK (DUF882 family)
VPWTAPQRLVLPGLTGALISLATSFPIATEPPVVHGSIPLAVRKDPDANVPCDTAQELETLGTIVSLHFDEAAPLSSDEPGAEVFASLTRDRVTGERAVMALRLLDLVRSLARERPPVRVEIVSGYRSWKLNEMLRKKEHRVAEHSQHSLGRAMDFRLEGLSSRDLAGRIEKAGWDGGLAFYPGDTDRFVHADVGPKRRWRGR